MVSRTVFASRRGAGQIRHLLFLLFVVVIAYYGVGVGSVFLREFRMEREMKNQARMAPGLDDETIRRRLVSKADALGLPEPARRFVIQRRARPREIVIRTSWQEPLDLPFLQIVVTLNPVARSAL